MVIFAMDGATQQTESITVCWMSVRTNKTYWVMLSTGCWFIQCINQRPSIEKFASGIFLVAVDGGWSGWSQWSHCTKNISGIQVRTRGCVNPNPQSGQKPCPGPDVTVIRGCTSISQCHEGTSQLLKNFLLITDAPSRLSLSYSQFTYLGILSKNYLSELAPMGCEGI